MELISFGYKNGPPGETETNFNLRKMGQPAASVRHGKTGMISEFQKEIFLVPGVESFYRSLKAEVISWILHRLSEMPIDTSVTADCADPKPVRVVWLSCRSTPQRRCGRTPLRASVRNTSRFVQCIAMSAAQVRLCVKRVAEAVAIRSTVMRSEDDSS